MKKIFMFCLMSGVVMQVHGMEMQPLTISASTDYGDHLFLDVFDHAREIGLCKRKIQKFKKRLKRQKKKEDISNSADCSKVKENKTTSLVKDSVLPQDDVKNQKTVQDTKEKFIEERESYWRAQYELIYEEFFDLLENNQFLKEMIKRFAQADWMRRQWQKG